MSPTYPNRAISRTGLYDDQSCNMKNWIKCTGAFYRDSVALCRSRIAAADREIGGKALSAATRSVQESRSCFFLQWKCGTGYPHDTIRTGLIGPCGKKEEEVV